MPTRYMSSADFDAVVTHTAPAILALLGDGRPRSKKAIVTALAERHPKDEIVRTLMRLAVTDRLVEIDHKYGMPPPSEPNHAGAEDERRPM